MFINEELNWPQFQSLNHIKNFPINEQLQQYNKYLNDNMHFKLNVREEQFINPPNNTPIR